MTRNPYGNQAGASVICFALMLTACKGRTGAARPSALESTPHEQRSNNFDNGQKKESFSVVKDEHGNYVKDGPYALFHKNGQKAEEGAFKNDDRDGHWQSWAEDGKLTEDVNYRAGKRDGAFTVYESGVKTKSGSYKDDELDGPYEFLGYQNLVVSGKLSHGKHVDDWVIADTSGKVRARAKFQEDKLGLVQSFAEDGSLRAALEPNGCAEFSGYTLGTVHWADVVFDLLARKSFFPYDIGTNKYSGGPMLRFNGDLLEMRGLKQITLIFDEHEVLTALSAKAEKQIGSGSYANAFKELHAKYSTKYRVVSASLPFVGDYYAKYRNEGCSIELVAEHLDFDMLITLDSAEFDKRFAAMH